LYTLLAAVEMFAIRSMMNYFLLCTFFKQLVLMKGEGRRELQSFPKQVSS